LADATTVVNVGAGSGSYEPHDRALIAVELSPTMIRQRPPGAATAIQADALSLPFRDNAFDAAMAILTVHHWTDQKRGLRELRRVSRGRVVILTWDPAQSGRFWLMDYVPEILDTDRHKFPQLQEYEDALGPIEVVAVPIPHDCVDGFMCAYWRRPAAYLDPRVRGAISTFAKLGNITAELNKLREDLESGAWQRRYSDILNIGELDLGYRLIVAEA